MTKDELKQDFYFELRDRFRHTTDPYQDVAVWALNEFIAEYLANKLAICSVSNQRELLLAYEKFRTSHVTYATDEWREDNVDLFLSQ